MVYDLKYDGAESDEYLISEASRILDEVVDKHTSDSLKAMAVWVFKKDISRMKRNVSVEVLYHQHV